MGEWPEYPLGCFVNPSRAICYGIVQPGKPYDGGVPIVRVNNLKDGRVDSSDALRVDPEIEERYERSRLEGGELLLTLVGSMGLSAIVPNELRGWNVARAVGVIPLKENVDRRWLHFVLRSQPSQDFIQTHANTTVQATFNLRDLARLPIPMPPDDLRLPASELLSALDDKIELNRRMNDTLEAIARALFKDWFVDFGPTRAKVEGRAPYLTPGLWDLFAATLDYDDKPTGWHDGKLDELIFLQRGFDLPKSKRVAGKHPVLAASGVNGTHDEAKVPGPGVSTGRSGVIGKVFYAYEDFWPLNTSLWVKEYRNSSPAHAYYLLQTINLNSFNSGSAVPTLNRNHIHKLPMVVPPLEVVEGFDRFVAPLFQRRRVNEVENHTLEQTRDLLLPKLMSGEIRLREAENTVEAVA